MGSTLFSENDFEAASFAVYNDQALAESSDLLGVGGDYQLYDGTYSLQADLDDFTISPFTTTPKPHLGVTPRSFLGLASPWPDPLTSAAEHPLPFPTSPTVSTESPVALQPLDWPPYTCVSSPDPGASPMFCTSAASPFPSEWDPRSQVYSPLPTASPSAAYIESGKQVPRAGFVDESDYRVCPFPKCGRVCKSSKDLIQHRRCHTRRYTCQIEGCPRSKGFGTRRDLHRHVEQVHKKERRQCDYCHKNVKRQDNLKRHIARLHADKSKEAQKRGPP